MSTSTHTSRPAAPHTDAGLHDLEPAAEDLRDAVLAGLSATPRTLPSQFFYDAAGSALFERICALPSYYLTRTELQIMRQHAAAMARHLGRDAVVIELGSGAGIKTRQLLAALDEPAAYLPIDISREALLRSVAMLRQRFAGLTIRPVCADYSQPFDLPDIADAGRRTVYFPGSTLGNLHAPQARGLFRRVRELAGDGGGLLLGIDRVKSPSIMIPAYDDPEGVTGAFNLNLLRRINDEAGADFDLSRWRHEARWNAEASRMESHLVSRGDQEVHLGSAVFGFRGGESIWTESSYKYDLPMVRDLAEGHFELVEEWSDARGWFSVMYLRGV